jgi:Phospholipid-translocating P-type ATPase C-terminal
LFFTSFVIGYVGLFDKDVTYEYVMSEEEADKHYGVDRAEYSGWGLDDSYIPTSRVKILPLIKKHFHLLYQTTQKGQSFGWHTFVTEVLDSIVVSLLLWGMGYSVMSGDVVVNINGHTSDYWMASFAIYASLICMVNVSLLVRVDQITWALLGYIAFLSLGPFVLLSIIFDTVLPGPNTQQRILFNLGETCQYYLLCIFLSAVVFLIEICKKMYRLQAKPNLPDYFKQLIKNGTADEPERFKKEILDCFKENEDEPIKKKRTKKPSQAPSVPTVGTQILENGIGNQPPVELKVGGAPDPEVDAAPSESEYSESSVLDEAKHSSNNSTTLRIGSMTNEQSNRSQLSLGSDMQSQIGAKPRIQITFSKEELSEKPARFIVADKNKSSERAIAELGKPTLQESANHSSQPKDLKSKDLRSNDMQHKLDYSSENSHDFEEDCKPHIPQELVAPETLESKEPQKRDSVRDEEQPRLNNFFTKQSSEINIPPNSVTAQHNQRREPDYVPELDKSLSVHHEHKS